MGSSPCSISSVEYVQVSVLLLGNGEILGLLQWGLLGRGREHAQSPVTALLSVASCCVEFSCLRSLTGQCTLEAETKTRDLICTEGCQGKVTSSQVPHPLSRNL